jgi:hypothetical protein
MMSDSVPSDLSAAEMIEGQLRKWMNHGNVHNVRLRPSASHFSLPPGEVPVAEIVNRNGQSIFFGEMGFALPGRRYIAYDEIESATWISRSADRLARKNEDFDHIEFSLRDGSCATLTDVDQAVFPLLTCFEWLIEQRKAAG